MVILELFYFHSMINDLRDHIGLVVEATAMALVVDQSLPFQWIRDPLIDSLRRKPQVIIKVYLQKTRQ